MMKATDKLKQLIIDKHWQNIPEHARPANVLSKYNTKRGANKIEAMIKDFLILSGHHCERTKNTGRLLDNKKVVVDCLGHHKSIGSSKWIPGTGTTGSSDLKAIINGRFIAIEVKYQRDKQSESQRIYEAQIKESGGLYMIAKSFEDFYSQYQDLISWERKERE